MQPAALHLGEYDLQQTLAYHCACAAVRMPAVRVGALLFAVVVACSCIFCLDRLITYGRNVIITGYVHRIKSRRE
jgi:hypothetical protein